MLIGRRGRSAVRKRRCLGAAVGRAEAPSEFMRQLRCNEIGMVFQEPMTSLNPVFTIERQLTDGLRIWSRNRCAPSAPIRA
jgi:ABC-type microcin C transport system duplicated ATPase subunit YejF